MGSLMAFGFDRPWAASEVLKKLRMESDLCDAFVVERASSGRCDVRRALDHLAPETKTDRHASLWAAMAGTIYLNYALDQSIPRGGSALFVVFENATKTRILRSVKPYGGRVLKTSASNEAGSGLDARLTRAA